MNLSTIVSNLKAVAELLPTIIKAIKVLEEQFPESGLGQQKLGLVRSILQGVYDNMDEFDSIWPYLNKAINAIVSFMNTTGMFSTKS